MADIKQKICYPMTKVPDHYVSVVCVPDGKTLYPGNMVVADTIDDAIDGNFQVRVPAEPTTESMKTAIVGVVINGGFEEMADGRRPAGNPDYSTYEFKSGDVCTIVWCLPKVMIYMSDACLAEGGQDDVGNFIVPTNASFEPTGTQTEPTAGAVKSYMKILAKKSTRAGGQFGGSFVDGSVCEVVNQ